MEFIYKIEMAEFLQLMSLAIVLSFPVCFLTELVKRVIKTKVKWVYILINLIISLCFALSFKFTFSKMSIGYSLWLGVFLFMCSAGFYEKMKNANGFWGNFITKSKKMIDDFDFEIPNENEEIQNEDDENEQEKQEGEQEGNTCEKEKDKITEPVKPVEPVKPAKPVEPEKPKPKPTKYAVGDVVYFNGNKVYKSPTETRSSGSPSKGNAKVTHTSTTGTHRIHLEPIKGGSGVFGWVDEKDCLNRKSEPVKPKPESAIPETQYFRFPVRYIGISQNFKSDHLGIDFGYSWKYGGDEVPILSAFAGKVVYAKDTGGTAGKMVRVRFDDKVHKATWYSNYKHLSRISVEVGQTVKQGQQVGRMGHTGGNYGNHLHFDLVRCPLGHVYNQSSERRKYSKNPLDYLWLSGSNIVGDVTAKNYKFKKR